MKKSSSMIAWVGFQRRAETMKAHWGYDIAYFPKVFKSRKLMAFDYMARILKTMWHLLIGAPKTVWIQAPPSFLVYLAALYKILHGEKVKVAIDVHNSYFREKWLAFPGLNFCMSKADAVIVHNEQVRHECQAIFPNLHNIFVLEDRAADEAVATGKKGFIRSVLFPCSFDEDEPIEVVFEAARLTPDVEFHVTGRFDGKISNDTIAMAPSNVRFTGFMPLEDFDDLLANCGAVLGLTTRSNVQLSVANEAISFRKAMVLSDTPTLRELFLGAKFVDTLDARSISEGILEVLSDIPAFEEASRRGLQLKNERWRSQASALSGVLNG